MKGPHKTLLQLYLSRFFSLIKVKLRESSRRINLKKKKNLK